ncbi:MAG: GH25 family lysozyme [Dehalococcoidia bacterium]|jgi:GH25 family lysozyme M1 (1,4-beta-N-acetylmuramidase)
MTITKAFDTSRWNHPNDEPIDFAQAYADGYRIHSPRASVGSYYIDPWFRRDFDAGRAAGFIEAPYHVTAPEYPDNLQVDKFIQALDGRVPDGVVIDAELHRDQTPIRVTACNRFHAERFSQMYPGRVLFYTNASFGNTYLLSNFGLPLFVANPGAGGGMNTNPAPYLPRLWDDFIAWQKDWKHAIPGVPDETNDYSEFQMSEQEARAYFGMEESEEDEMAIEQKLDDILTNQGVIISNQGIILQYLHDMAQNPVEPPTPPAPPAQRYYVQLKVDKTNARFVYRMKEGGIPIFQIYPGDSRPVAERIQFFKKDTPLLEVYKTRVRGDGNVYCYKLVGRFGRDGEELYVWAADVMKTW